MGGGDAGKKEKAAAHKKRDGTHRQIYTGYTVKFYSIFPRRLLIKPYSTLQFFGPLTISPNILFSIARARARANTSRGRVARRSLCLFTLKQADF